MSENEAAYDRVSNFLLQLRACPHLPEAKLKRRDENIRRTVPANKRKLIDLDVPVFNSIVVWTRTSDNHEAQRKALSWFNQTSENGRISWPLAVNEASAMRFFLWLDQQVSSPSRSALLCSAAFGARMAEHMHRKSRQHSSAEVFYRACDRGNQARLLETYEQVRTMLGETSETDDDDDEQ